MRIALEIQRTLDHEAARSHLRVFLSRLFARVRFRQSQGWSERHLAILDTGAPYTLIPLTLWAGVHHRQVRHVPLRGIIPGDHVEMPATLSRVSIQLLDDQRVSPPMKVWAMLAHTDRVPLILGWAGLLDHATLVVKASRHRAWLEL